MVVEFPKPGALVMLIGPKPPLAVKFRGDPGMVKPGIVTGLVPPLNGTFNPNGLIAKPGIVTGLVPRSTEHSTQTD
ncbi:PPE family protein PPE34 [Mycobacterium tuberculosis variant africanum]|nr:PPE family protein PPE34 [Mycobacterium tuberculosis variant africanum]